MAYGDDPPSDSIPKGATLIFEIELLEINGKKEHEVSNGSGKIINKSMHKRISNIVSKIYFICMIDIYLYRY